MPRHDGICVLRQTVPSEDIAKRRHESEVIRSGADRQAHYSGHVRSRKVGACDCYYYPIWVPGIIEGILTNKEQCERYPDIGYCFEEYARRRPEMVALHSTPASSVCS